MASGALAALAATLVLGFVEAMARFYPARRTWLKMRRLNGRTRMRKFRERMEATAENKTPRFLALVLFALVIVWVVLGARALDKRWYEVLLDLFPYPIVSIALLRMPSALRAVATRMKEFEEMFGDRPDEPDEGDGSAVVAL
jgi:hypothetical protein